MFSTPVYGKTGQICSIPGNYRLDRYTDGTRWPEPTVDEATEPYDQGDRFSPVRSCNKGAHWVLISPANEG